METPPPAFPLVAPSKLCLAALNSLLSSLKAAGIEHRSLMPPQTLRNQRDRFKIWAGNLGALQEGRASLDFRLRESILMQSAVHKLLKQLEDTVKRSSDVVRGVRKPLEESLTSADEKEDLWRDSDDDSSSDEQDGINTRTELGQNTLAILQIVSDLFKLSFKIRNPATRSSGQSVLKPLLFKQPVYVDVDDTTTVDLLACFGAFDRGHVQEAFRELRRSVHGRPRLKDVCPGVDSLAYSKADETSPSPPAVSDGPVIEPEEELHGFLIDRWSKSLTNRRRYFAYWENHARKLAKEDKEKAPDQADSKMPDWIETQPRPMPMPAAALAAALMTPAAAAPSLAGKTILSGTEGSTYELKLDDEVDTNSVVSYASTTYDIDGTVADLPRAPPVKLPQTEFQCPYCWVTCPARHARGKSWREHILRDLQPYMCTYEECSDADAMYASRPAWLAHEADAHRRVWRCFAHPEPLYTSQDALQQHLEAEHGAMLGPAQIREMAKRSHANTVDQRSVCPFCHSAGPFKRGLANHMAFHMEQLACFAAPRGPGADDDASLRGNNTNTAQGVRSAASLASVSLVFSDISTPALLSRRSSPAIGVGGDVDRTSYLESEDDKEKEKTIWIAKTGQKYTVPQLLEQGVDINSEDSTGRTPLSIAAELCYEADISLLLEHGADIESKDPEHGRTPLSWAAAYGSEAIVKLLLATGKVDVNSKDENGRTPLWWAAEMGHEAVVKLLLDTGKVDVNAKDKDYGRTPLWQAAANRHGAIVKLLLDTDKVDVNSKDEYGLTPLWQAAEKGHEAVVKLLLATGKVDVNSKDENGRTPLWWAAEKGHEAVVKLLLDTGKVDADAKDKYGRTPLWWAAANGHEAILKLLLDTGKVDVSAKDEDGQTPLWWAAANGHEAVVKLLLDTGKVDVSSKDEDGRTPLWWAAEKGHEAVVKLLLDTGKVDVNAKDKDYGQTPLWWAAEKGHEAIVKLLLDTGKVDVNSKDKYGRTPLWQAAEKGHEAVVKLLLATGKVDVNSKDEYGQTPLWQAAEKGHEAIVKLLLDTGKVDVNSKDEYGRTPLWWAAANGHEAVVKLLLDTGKVDPDAEDEDYGQTPLWWAAANGHEAVVKLLLDTGKVDPDAKDKGGRTPLRQAAANGHEAIVKLLQRRP